MKGEKMCKYVRNGKKDFFQLTYTNKYKLSMIQDRKKKDLNHQKTETLRKLPIERVRATTF